MATTISQILENTKRDRRLITAIPDKTLSFFDLSAMAIFAAINDTTAINTKILNAINIINLKLLLFHLACYTVLRLL